MGRASISIAITSNFNSRGIDQAIASAERLAVAAVHHQGKFGKAAVDMGASMGMAAARLVAMGKSVANLGDKLTMGVTVPMGLAAAAAVTSAAKIDTAWYNVRKTVDMTEEGYQKLKDGAMALSEVQPVSAETILNIEALGGQLGIANESLEDFAKIASGLEISTNLDATTAATELAQFRNIVQMSEDDLDNFASTLVDLGNHTATTEADIMNLATRFASAGHVAGMSNQEILGISAALSGLGMKAEAGGSALSRVINDISLAVDTNGEHLEAWAELAGKSVEDFTKSWKEDAAGTFEEVIKGIAASGDEMNATLDEVGVTQIRTSDAMRRLAASGDLMSESVERANRAWEENTALQREVDNRNESLQARWDTFCNRITNDFARIGQPIAEMGLNALEGLEPVIQGVGDLAQAFAGASPMVQQFAFNLAGVAMAAGPVLSITGRVMQGVGNMGQRVGRATQQWGVYQEALRTTDISMLNTLSNNKSMAAQFGASRNAIVKAAGGIDRYNVAYAKTTDAIRRNIEQQTRQTAYQEAYNEAVAKGGKTEEECVLIGQKAAHSRETTAVVTQRQKAAVNDLNSSLNEGNVATKLNTKAITEQEVAAAKASRTFGSFGTALKGALMGFGVSAAIGLAISGITWLVTSMQEAAERADRLDKATNGLRDSLSNTGLAAEEAGDKHRDFIASLGETHQHVEEAIQNQADLADKFRETDAQTSATVGSLTKAADTIREYANQSGLTALEHYKLESAIEQVNEACGTQYQVLEDGTVALEDETGMVQQSTDAILENIEARKKQVELDAIESKYGEAYQNQIDMQMAHAEAVDRLAKAKERLNELNSKEIDPFGPESQERLRLVQEIDQLEQEVQDTEQAAQAAGEVTSWLEAQWESAAGRARDLGEAMQGIVDPAGRISNAFYAARGDIYGFAAACQTAGINFDSLNSLSGENLQSMANNFDGTVTSIIRSLEEFGRTDILDNLSANWRSSLDEASQALADGISNTHGVALAELGALATDLGIQGEDAMRRFLSGIEAGLSGGLNIDQAAQLAKRISEEFDQDLSPEQAAEIARRFLENLAAGMGDTAAIEQAIQGFKRTLSQVDFTAEGQQAKSTWLAGFNAGGGSGEGTGLQPFANGLYSELDTIHNTINEQGLVTGEDVPLKLAEGANANAGAVTGAGDSIIASLMAALTGGVGQAEGIGSETGSGYGNAVSNQGGTAEYAAMQTLGRLLMIWLTGIAAAQQAGLRTGQAYGQGVSSSALLGVSVVQATVQTILSIMQAAVGPATAAGQMMGTGFAQSLSQMMLNAAIFTQAAVVSIVSMMQAGVAPATSAGQRVGTGFTNGIRTGATPAISIARNISISTGAAFGSGSGAAAAAGTRLGAAFANAVRASAQAAVGYAQAARSQVQSILDSIPTSKTVTLNVKTNVQRTALALPSQTPVFQLGPGGTVTPFAGAARGAATAQRAAQRIAAVRESNSPRATVGGAAVNAVRTTVAAIDYDAMYRVVKGAMTEAMREAPPVTAKVDGYRLMEIVDKGLARKGAMY